MVRTPSHEVQTPSTRTTLVKVTSEGGCEIVVKKINSF
jgi:hypothetical protein